MKRVAQSIRKFCDKQELVRLSYIDGKGYPRVVPLWFVKVRGRYCAGTARSSPKWKAIRRNSRVGWVIDGGKNYRYKGLSLAGRAQEITDKKLRAAVYRALAVKYFGSANDPGFKELFGDADDRETVYFCLNPELGSSWEY